MDSVDPGIFEAWLASTDDGVVAVDAEGLVVLHNPAASRVTGLAPSAARRRPWRDVLQLDPTVSELLWAARLTGRRAVTLANVLCAQGNLRTAETLAHPWTDAAGQYRHRHPDSRPHRALPAPERARRAHRIRRHGRRRSRDDGGV